MSLSSFSLSALPVEIQLAITQHLDIKTLLSLSLVSHHNHTLCLPAVFSVRGRRAIPKLLLLTCRVPVGLSVVLETASALPRSRAS